MTGDVYIKLREQLDQYSIGFPATASGIEMRILQRLFSEDEAELFLTIDPHPRKPGSRGRAIEPGRRCGGGSAGTNG